jgi:signal transduction histidine kinase
MDTIPDDLRTWVPRLAAPVAAAVFVLLWTVAEAGRGDLVENVVVFGLFGIAIGLSVWMPWTSVGVLTVVPALQLAGWIEPPGSTTWPTYLAIAFVAFFAAFARSVAVRLVVLAAAGLASGLAAIAMAVPTLARPYVWSSWVGGGQGTKTDVITLAASLFGAAAAAWAVGIFLSSVLRVRRIGQVLELTETRFHETDFELRLAHDRARISRDVHDALAHSLAVVVSQAQGALALSATRPEVVEQALRTIADVGRTSLVDVRHLVERIQQDTDDVTPRETLADLDRLTTTMRDVGMTVTLRHLGDAAELLPSQELAVFRIVQESLTNALKHSGSASTVDVALDWRGPGLALLVTSSGDDPLVAARRGTGRGTGIASMTERARLAGGWLTAELGDDGVFVVTAFLPTPEPIGLLQSWTEQPA